MLAIGRYINKQAQLMLANPKLALIQTALLALLPYTEWVSAAIVGLITLRLGEKWGSRTMIAGIIAAMGGSVLFGLNLSDALTHALMTFLPCYVGAYVLRVTQSWQSVALVFGLFSFIVLSVLALLAPAFVESQSMYFQQLIGAIQPGSAMMQQLNQLISTNPKMVAYTMLGAQATSAVFSAVFSLTFSRSVQSNLFYPGGFRREMLTFRAHPLALFILIALVATIYCGIAFSTALIPLALCYFLFAGLSVSFHFLPTKQKNWMPLLFIFMLLFLPLVMMPICVLFGSLDSIFNFRTGKTV